MRIGSGMFAAALGLAGLLHTALPPPILANGGHKGAGEEKVEARPTKLKLLDLELFDQDGRKLAFRNDVIGDKIVVIDTFYTSCRQICPILSAIFAGVQEQLAERLGKEVVLVSISVDPETDIPPRLKKYAGTWKARPGWTFLTGPKPSVDRVLEGLGLYTADFKAHAAMILIGDGRKNEWTRFYGFLPPEQIVEKVDELSAARRAKP
jgi:protein SCO1/2